MRSAARFISYSLLTLCCLASAQTQRPAPAPSKPGSAPATPQRRPEQRIERIRHEDAGSRIDELRVGGETKNITVQPKGDAPPYQVGPEDSNRNPASTDRQRGGGSPGGWKVLGF